MKKITQTKSKRFILSLATSLIMCIASAQVSITVNVPTAGGLRTAIIAAGGNKTTTTNLTVTGNMDARDVKFMRDSMPVLAVIDMETTQIKGYSGTEGTNWIRHSFSYPENQLPIYSFYFVDTVTNNSRYKTSLISIKLPNTITSTGEGAFIGCSGLTGIYIPNSVKTIGVQTFVSCIGLTGDLVIPNSVTTIKSMAFQYCYGFNSKLILPNSIKVIEEGAFDGCNFTGTLKLPEEITNISQLAFQGCGFTDIIFPNNLKSIKYDAFGWCRNLKDLIFPNSVTSISDGFRVCTGLTEIYLPSSLTSLSGNSKSGAFIECNSLKKIVINKTTPLNIDTFTFNGVNKNTCELIVLVGSKAAYQAAIGWNLFINITEAIFVTLNTKGGNPAAPITITLTNSTITEPDVPVRDGYSFVGWYKEAACTNAWNFTSDIVTAPVTLYAKWTQNPVNITNREISGFKLYPNPATTKLNLGYLPQSAQISIFSIDGKLMKQQNITTSESTIDIEDFPKGVYLLKVNNKEINMLQKFIKQ